MIKLAIRSIAIVLAGLSSPFTLLIPVLIATIAAELTGWLVTGVVTDTTSVVRVVTPMMRIFVMYYLVAALHTLRL